MALEKASLALSKDSYHTKVTPSTLLPQHLGNMYTASLYAGLLSLLASGAPLVGRRILCFSYGSGLASSIFSIHIPATLPHPSPLASSLLPSAVPGAAVDVEALLAGLRASLAIPERLAARVQKTPAEFEAMMEKRERLHAATEFRPEDGVEELVDGAWYLVEKDAASRRQYKQKGSSDAHATAAPTQ